MKTLEEIKEDIRNYINSQCDFYDTVLEELYDLYYNGEISEKEWEIRYDAINKFPHITGESELSTQGKTYWKATSNELLSLFMISKEYSNRDVFIFNKSDAIRTDNGLIRNFVYSGLDWSYEGFKSNDTVLIKISDVTLQGVDLIEKCIDMYNKQYKAYEDYPIINLQLAKKGLYNICELKIITTKKYK